MSFYLPVNKLHCFASACMLKAHDHYPSNRATACDIITHRNQYKIHFHMARLCHRQMCAIVIEPQSLLF